MLEQLFPPELKPCGHCGGDNIKPARLGPGRPYTEHFWYYCRDCCARGPIKLNLDDALVAWNKRHVCDGHGWAGESGA